MNQALSTIALVVSDYDEAIAFYVGTLGFELVEDTDLGGGKRWVRVRPKANGGPAGAALLLARAANADQAATIGNQAGGRVMLFLDTDDFERDYRSYLEKGVTFEAAPRTEDYGRVAVFRDLYGNRWDLVQRR